MVTSEKFFALFISIFTVLLIVFALAVPGQGLRNKKLDEQTVSALSEVETALGEYKAENRGNLPGSVGDLKFSDYSNLDKDSGAIKRITIEGSGNDYKLCGNFYTDTLKNEKSNDGDGSEIGTTLKYAFGGGGYGNKYSEHGKGKHCFDSKDNYYDDYSPDLFNSNSSSSSSYSSSSTSQSISAKADDAERKSDINALYTQLEVYYADNGKYPALSEINDSSFRSKNLKSITNGMLTDPEDFTPSLALSPQSKAYSYQTNPVGCDNKSSTCEGYTLSATLSSGEKYSKTDLN